MNVSFYKTIRFKLTLWYSVLIIFAALILISSINIIVSSELNKPFNENVPQRVLVQLDEFDSVVFENPQANFRELVAEIRKDDMQKLRAISVIAFGMISLLSVGGGYVVAGKLLDPIRKINLATKQATVKNLKRIDHSGVDDEIGELIENFNAMIDRLSKAFDAQSEFVHNAAHELKTPLTAIRLNLDTLSLDELDSEQKSLLTDATSAIEFMSKLVDDLLLLSQVDSDDFLEENIAVKTVLKDSLEQLKSIASQKNISINTDIEINDETVMGSSTLLQRAFMNIIENAIKYSPSDSAVDIKARKKNKTLIISFCDKGEGIAIDEREKVFRRFYRIDKSRARHTGGTGLGLSITKEILELHGGSIKITNNKPKGTKIIVKLPTT